MCQIFNIILCLSIFSALFILFVTDYTIPLPKTIRVAAPKIERIFPSVEIWGPGFEKELLKEYGNMVGSKVIITPYPTHQAAFNALKSGKADIFIGAGYTPKINGMSIFIEPGLVYEKNKATILHHTNRYELRNPEELCDQQISAPNNPSLIKNFKTYSGSLDCAPELLVSQNATQFTNLLEYNSDKDMRFHLVETGNFKQLQPFIHRLIPTGNFGKELDYRWYWRKDVPGLSASLKKFWEKVNSNGTMTEKRELYFGFLPDDTDFYELYMIREDIREKLPLYTKYIMNAARKYKLDPLFAAAVMYQESRFDPLARSRTGVRGLMQLTNSTAGFLGISSRIDPEQSTLGGIIYLKKMWKWIGRRNVKGWNRWFLTLAAYNQGIGHVHDAMDVAKYLKKPPKSWNSLKEVFPLLTQRKYHTKTRYGYTRGYEAVDYVDSVRYYYYIFKELAVIPGPELKYLVPLNTGIPTGWP